MPPRTLSARRFALAPLLALSLLVPRLVVAQAKDPAAASELFNQGRDAMKAGDYATACPRLAQSQELDPKVGTLLNLADCEEHIGKLTSARTHWQQALDRAQAEGDSRVSLAKDRLEKIDKRVPKLTIKLDPAAPPDTTVERDGVTITQGGFGVALPVDPGAHKLIVKAKGWEDETIALTLREGEPQEVVVAPKRKKEEAPPPVVAPPPPPTPASAAPPPPPPPEPPRQEPPPPPPPPEPKSSDQNTIGKVLIVVGSAGLALGFVSGGLVLAAKSTVEDPSHCQAKQCDSKGVDAASSGKTWSTIGTVSFLVGLAGLGGGIALVVTDKGPAPATVGFTPVPGGGAAAFTARF